MSWPTKMRGDKDPVVRTLQYLLRAQGKDLRADGDFGPATEAAVQDHQAGAGLPTNGVAGPEVWEGLIAELRMGAAGEAVKALQTQLYVRGTLPAVDGVYSMKTDISLRRFQVLKHLPADGVAGRATWEALLSDAELPAISEELSDDSFDWQAKLRSMLRPDLG